MKNTAFLLIPFLLLLAGCQPDGAGNGKSQPASYSYQIETPAASDTLIDRRYFTLIPFDFAYLFQDLPDSLLGTPAAISYHFKAVIPGHPKDSLPQIIHASVVIDSSRSMLYKNLTVTPYSHEVVGKTGDSTELKVKVILDAAMGDETNAYLSGGICIVVETMDPKGPTPRVLQVNQVEFKSGETQVMMMTSRGIIPDGPKPRCQPKELFPRP